MLKFVLERSFWRAVRIQQEIRPWFSQSKNIRFTERKKTKYIGKPEGVKTSNKMGWSHTSCFKQSIVTNLHHYKNNRNTTLTTWLPTIPNQSVYSMHQSVYSMNQSVYSMRQEQQKKHWKQKEREWLCLLTSKKTLSWHQNGSFHQKSLAYYRLVTNNGFPCH